MKILFLEDNDERIFKAQQLYKNVEVLSIAKTASIAIEFLKTRLSYDVVHLDHDLGGEVYVDSSREDCGMEVVRFLCENNHIYSDVVKVVTVHSWNIPASQEMFKKLREAGYTTFMIPFGVQNWDIGNHIDLV